MLENLIIKQIIRKWLQV